MRKKAAERLGVQGPLLKGTTSLSVRNGVRLFKQLISPMIDYAYTVWRFATRSHVRKIKELQSKCLRITINALWYNGNWQIHKDLVLPLFLDHIRFLTARFDSKLDDVREHFS